MKYESKPHKMFNFSYILGIFFTSIISLVAIYNTLFSTIDWIVIVSGLFFLYLTLAFVRNLIINNYTIEFLEDRAIYNMIFLKGSIKYNEINKITIIKTSGKNGYFYTIKINKKSYLGSIHFSLTNLDSVKTRTKFKKEWKIRTNLSYKTKKGYLFN